MMRKAATAGIVCAGCFMASLAGPAHAACPDRVSVSFGDTLASIAQDCGVNVEALRQLNPGLNAKTLRQGTFVRMPRPALSSPQTDRRSGRVEATRPLVRSPTPGGTPTVILPPEPDYRTVNPFKPDILSPNNNLGGPGLPGLGIQPFNLQRN